MTVTVLRERALAELALSTGSLNGATMVENLRGST